MSDTPIITRFAPSPTGYLHIGGARTALFNYAFARKHGGKFLLRFEDTDRARSSEAAEQSILEDLQWLGLDWDNAGDEPRQSQRLDLYNEAIEELQAADRVYEHADGNGALVFRMPATDVTFVDEVRGRNTTPAGQIDDFVIRKADGFPTFHLAVVVDDAAMGVTHVLRGQDHLTNTAKHVALQEALGLPTPIYAHMSLTNNPDGSKLGKRDKAKAARKAASEARLTALERTDPGLFKAFMDKESDAVDIAIAIAEHLGVALPEIDVRDFRASGYLPAALCNYLGLLGWNPGEDIEDFGPNPLAFLAERFALERFVKGNATFDRQKLAAFNAERIKALGPEALQQGIWKLNAERLSTRFSGADDALFAAFCEAYRERSKTLLDPVDQGAFFFTADDAIEYEFESKGAKKAMIKGEYNGFTALEELRPALAELPETDFGTAVHELIKQWSDEREMNMGKWAQPLRVAVSGGTVTPPIDATLNILGKASTLARIDRCLAAKPD
jgi:glutamyl/glutaminyl-tRNA synthetase